MGKKILDNVVAIFVVVIIVSLLIPMPPAILDFLFIVNISISVVILLMSMYIKEALEFSIFPSMLLVTTLFRLALNASSTRLILKNAGQAGKVIKTFGEFVLQGDVVVGVIIFIIIVLVQFIVITKGAERVAEVSARFTLDAMPGKQMAIDADLSSGIITEQEARIRREKVQREADFYGAMDGSTKIVKGDAVMSIIITVINFIGGVAIGALQGGMSFGQVLTVYSIATIGDGLVSQIPALLISSATGMIVTRSVSQGSLNDDVIKQFLAKPTVLILAGIMMGCIVFIPGAPFIQPALVSAFLVGLGIYSSKKQIQEALELEAPTMDTGIIDAATVNENDFYKDINNVYALLPIEPIEMEFGYSLIPLVDQENGGSLINRIVIFRRKFAQEMGFVVPSIRLRNSAFLNANEYVIKLKGEVIASGELLTDYYLALEPPEPEGVVDGIDTIEPAYGIPSKWITADKRELAELYGYTVIDPLSVMVTHLGETIQRHAYEMMSRVEMMQLLDSVKSTCEDLVNEAVPSIISYANMQSVLSNLLKEGIPIRDMVTIFETIIRYAPQANDTTAITEKIREGLKRTITRKFCENGQLMVITLDADVEKTILSALVRNEQGIYLSLSPDLTQKLIMQIIEYAKKFTGLGQNPVILTSHIIRPYVYRLIEQFNPNVTVLSFNEIVTNVQIQALANITF